MDTRVAPSGLSIAGVPLGGVDGRRASALWNEVFVPVSNVGVSPPHPQDRIPVLYWTQ